jgi:hypothetical protein
MLYVILLTFYYIWAQHCIGFRVLLVACIRANLLSLLSFLVHVYRKVPIIVSCLVLGRFMVAPNAFACAIVQIHWLSKFSNYAQA